MPSKSKDPVIPKINPILVNKDRIAQAQELMKQVLTLLRKEKNNLGIMPGGREIATAITQFELGCMVMIRSKYADVQPDYDPTGELRGYATK